MATQQNGLTMLGEAISRGAGDYANRKLALEDEARRRQNQLTDVASARAYEDQVYGRRRADTLADQTTARQQDAAMILVHEGLLAPGDIGDAQKIAAAYEVARQRGLDKLYVDLTTTPGPDGKPILDRSNLNNPDAIEAAKRVLAQIKATAGKLQMEQPANAQATLDSLGAEGQQVRQQLASVEAKLAETQPALNEQVVLNRALQLATDAKGGKTPSKQEIQAMVAQATQEAQTQQLQRWYQDKEDAKVQYQILNARLNNIRQQQSDLTKTFQIAPRASALVEPAAVSAPARGAEASPEQRQAALVGAIRAATQPAGAPPAPVPGNAPQAAALPNPIADPIIEAENRRINQRNLGAQNSALADPYNQALDDLASVNQQIAQVRSGAPVLRQPADEFGAGAMTVQRDPSMQAKALSDLLIKQQQVTRDLEAKRRAMLGIGAAVTAPVLSNAAGSTPAEFGRPDDWWRG